MENVISDYKQAGICSRKMISGKLRVSSWGRSYYINYDEYISYMENYAFLRSKGTNMLYIKKK